MKHSTFPARIADNPPQRTEWGFVYQNQPRRRHVTPDAAGFRLRQHHNHFCFLNKYLDGNPRFAETGGPLFTGDGGAEGRTGTSDFNGLTSGWGKSCVNRHVQVLRNCAAWQSPRVFFFEAARPDFWDGGQNLYLGVFFD